MPDAAEAVDTPRDAHARALREIQSRVEELHAILWPLQFDNLHNPLVDSERAKLRGAGCFRLQSAAEDVRGLYNAVEPETAALTDGRSTALAFRACALLGAFGPALEEMAGQTDVGIVKLMYFYDATTELLDDLDRCLAGATGGRG